MLSFRIKSGLEEVFENRICATWVYHTSQGHSNNHTIIKIECKGRKLEELCKHVFLEFFNQNRKIIGRCFF